jgi:cobalt-zinc-cadmium efflux system membrane fusion protein
VRTVTARYPGVIRSVGKSIGDAVRQGDVLAQIESNESLRSYDITAPIAGVVTQRNANPGENSADQALFTITDLSRVVAELSVFPRDVSRIKTGQRARIRAVDGGRPVDGEVVRVSAGAGANQALKVRIALGNADGRWTPGRYVTGEVMIATAEVPVAVRADAVQRLRDWNVAFENVGDVYEARPLQLGRSDGVWVEVTAGLASGARYVSQNSFLIKADIEKSGASHDH